MKVVKKYVISIYITINKIKSAKRRFFMIWADDRIWTDDLIPTKDVLYQLSYVSNCSAKLIKSI